MALQSFLLSLVTSLSFSSFPLFPPLSPSFPLFPSLSPSFPLFPPLSHAVCDSNFFFSLPLSRQWHLFKSGRNYCLNLFNQHCKSKDVTAILLLIFSWRTRRVSHSLELLTHEGKMEREKFQREEMRHAWVLRTSLQLKRSVLRFSTNINQETFRSSLSLPREDERRRVFSSRMIYLWWRALLFLLLSFPEWWIEIVPPN